MDQNTFKKYHTKKMIYYGSFIFLIILLLVEFIIVFLYSINLYTNILIYPFTFVIILIVCSIIAINKVKFAKYQIKYLNYILKNTPDIELKFTDLQDLYEHIKTRLIKGNFTMVNGNIENKTPFVFKRSEKKKITPGSNQAYSRTNCTYEQIVVLKTVDHLTREDFYKLSSDLYNQFNHKKANRNSLDKNTVYKANLTFLDVFIVIVSENIDTKLKDFFKVDGRLHKEFANFYFIGIDLCSKKMLFNYEQHWFRKTHVLYNGISAYFPILDFLLFISKYILGYKKKYKFKKLIKSTEIKLLKG